MRHIGVVFPSVSKLYNALLGTRISHKNTLIMVKTMRALKYFPTVEDPNTRRSLFERILLGTDVVKNVNKNIASHAVLFEALAVVMHHDAEREMMTQCVSLLGKFISFREPNIQYLGLENKTRMLMVTDGQDMIKKNIEPGLLLLRRFLTSVEELLQYLKAAEFAMREELSHKAAILAEKFAPDLSCLLQTMKGVLILSEFAGAAQSLGAGAILVNPWNVTEVAASICYALDMPADEREKRHQVNFKHVRF
ncbi:hypothetical protein PIB30_004672 [Stylosanthes scabra]|uniref:Uncharacterized protein n=1 Tax=Stylosanthes scabra TaxID=79078 RepID=A0ABU6Q3R7_9FABA|nr:hypothetical protein [Stylosanthes scabra]